MPRIACQKNKGKTGVRSVHLTIKLGLLLLKLYEELRIITKKIDNEISDQINLTRFRKSRKSNALTKTHFGLLNGSLSRFAFMNSCFNSSSVAPLLMGVRISTRLSLRIRHGFSLPSLVTRIRVQCMQKSLFSVGCTTSTVTSGRW